MIQLVNRQYVRRAGAFSGGGGGVAQPLVNPHAPAQPRRHGDAWMKNLEFFQYLPNTYPNILLHLHIARNDMLVLKKTKYLNKVNL